LPLIICTIFFVLLFTCEIVWFQVRSTQRKYELSRYQQVEHPRRLTSDRYIDLLS